MSTIPAQESAATSGGGAPVRAALLGCGYWGKNLLRNLCDGPRFASPLVCDASEERRAWAVEQRGVEVCEDFERDVLGDKSIEAVVIATPAGMHAGHVRAALQAGKHVLVEKPLALDAEEAAALARLADERGLTLLVGHTFLYHAAVRRMRRELAAEALGELFYLTSARLAMGIVRGDVDAVWNLAPHDVSIANYLFDERPLTVAAQGTAHLREGRADVAFLHLQYGSGRRAHLHVSWLHPSKVREVAVVGSRGTMIFDDVRAEGKLRLNAWERAAPDDEAQTPPPFETFTEFESLRAVGAERTPDLDFREPLAVELEHFADCLRSGARPLTDGRNGADVVAVLAAASESLRRDGAPFSPRYAE